MLLERSTRARMLCVWVGAGLCGFEFGCAVAHSSAITLFGNRGCWDIRIYKMEQRGHHKVYDEARISCGWMCSANTASVIVRVRGVFLYTDIYKQNISSDPKYVIGCGSPNVIALISCIFI